MALYCPNCSAKLSNPVSECWNCGAVFGEGSDWVPARVPSGAFKRRERSDLKSEDSEPSTRSTKYFVLLSLVANLAAVGYVVSTVPGSRSELAGLAGYGLEQWVNGIPMLLGLFLLTCGPWLLALANATTQRYRSVARAFALISLFTCAGFLALKPSAPPEAISYHVALYVPVVWGAFVLSLLFRGQKSSS